MARVFISYSHRDSDLMKRLQVHLAPLHGQGVVELWDDTRIRAGSVWREEISRELATCEVAVLLLSADYFASEFIQSMELPSLLEAENQRGLRILLVVLKPCRFAYSRLSQFQAVNPVDQPLSRMNESDQEEVWMRVTEIIEETLASRSWDASSTLETAPLKDLSAITPPAASSTLPEGYMVTIPPTEAVTTQTLRKVWTVPYEYNPFFTGRDEALAAIRAALEDRSRTALSGIGGCGKTQAAVEYAYRHKDDYDHAFWINATSELTMSASCADVLQSLGLAEAQDANQTRVVAATRRWLESNPGWLLILDAADEPGLVKPLLPVGRPGHVLVTSRNPTLHLLGIPTTITLDEMAPDEAVAFLMNRTQRDLDNAEELTAAAALASDLGYLPLALEQASAYITANHTRFRDYLRGYRRRSLRVLSPPVSGEYPESVATTWALNLREVEQVPAAADLLRLASFLSPDHIPLELLARGTAELGPELSRALADVADDPLLIDETLEPLFRYSLIRRDLSSRTFSVHRIMQAVLLNGMPPDEQVAWAERAVRAVNASFPEPRRENWDRCERFAQHALACAELIETHGFEFDEAVRLLVEAGRYLRKRALYSEAASLKRQTLEIRERNLGSDHPLVARSLLDMARLLRDQGRYDEALIQMDRGVAIAESSLDEGDPLLARCVQTRSAILRNLGRLDEAEGAARRALAIREEALGPEHRDVAKSLSNLAVLLKKLDRHAEAEELARRSLRIEEKVLGVDHPNLATSLTTVADLCLAQGRPEEAKPLLQRALDMDRKALGSDHPDVAWSLYGLAETHVAQGDRESAEKLLRKALKNREQGLGASHPQTVSTRKRYVELLRELGRESDADSVERKGR